MKALVLAAGYATRLYPLTLDRPKALLEVGGRPMLDHVLERLEEMGVDETIVVTNAKFTPHFEEWAAGRSRVRIVNDGTTSNDDRLGAIGDTGFVLDQTGLDDDLVVVAGDNLFGEDVSGFAAYGQEVDAPVLAVHDVGDLTVMSEYNQVEIDDEGRITFFEEKPENARSTLAGVALYFYPRHTLPLIREYLKAGNNPDQPGRLIEWLYPRTSVYTWRLPGRWYDIGSAETLQEADRIFSQSRNRVAADNDGVLELLFPERCAVCRRPGSALCEHCRDSFVRLSPPLCERCGSPGAWPVRRCAECSGRRLAFSRARAAIVYDGGAKSFVRSWKERGQRRLAAVAAEIVADAISIPDVDVLAHVPGDPERAWQRGMVAPKGLALALGSLWRLPAADLLRRLHSLPRQRGLALADRRRNVRGSVVARGDVPRSVCLVDDVYTSGATADACASALRRAGASRVEVVTFARAVR